MSALLWGVDVDAPPHILDDIPAVLALIQRTVANAEGDAVPLLLPADPDLTVVRDVLFGDRWWPDDAPDVLPTLPRRIVFQFRWSDRTPHPMEEPA